MFGKRARAALALVVGLGLCVGLMGASFGARPDQSAQEVAAKKPKPPNIVLILIDDFSSNLLKTMPNTLKLKRQGAYFPNMIVADSLCCTSRSALLTGLYPHNNGVRMNTRGQSKAEGPPLGGWPAFLRYHNLKKTFANAINHRDKGRRYRTGFYGKFLNGYKGKAGKHVPKGWSRWHPIVGGGYDEWKFRIPRSRKKANGQRVLTYKGCHGTQAKGCRYSARPRDYATSVLKRRAVQFMNDGSRKRPYFIEIAPYATHSRVPKHGKNPPVHKSDPLFPPAFRDRPHPNADEGDGGPDEHGNCGAVNCTDLWADELPGFNNPTKNNRPQFNSGEYAPRWQSNNKLGHDAKKTATRHLRNRARMAQAVDRLVGRVRREARPNTYIIVTSDNGFHLGQHRSKRGKGTAYDYDIRVPMIVYKKAVKKRNRITPGMRRQVVSNVDLAPTIRRLARTKMADRRNGVSVRKAIESPNKRMGLKYAFVEHTKPNEKGPYARKDPDLRVGRGRTSSVPSYIAVRSRKAVLIRYRVNGRYAWEYYRYHPGRKNGMVEKVNTYYRNKKTDRVQNMKAALRMFDDCKPRACRAARRLLGRM